jgi:drug/metabolite transporter (DMT)-like permease
MMLRALIAMTVAAGAAAVGQILLRQGMQQIGSLERFAPGALAAYFGTAVCNPYVIWGTVLNTVFYVLFLASLSWAGVTVVLPMTAIEFAFAAVLAVIILNEAVPTLRWAGIALVIAGVILISLAGGDA